MLRKCLNNTVQRCNTHSRASKLSFSSVCSNRSVTRLPASAPSKSYLNSYLSPRNNERRRCMTTAAAPRHASGPSNAAYAAKQAAEASRQKQIVLLMEKRMRDREQLVQLSLSGSEGADSSSSSNGGALSTMSKIQASKLLKDLEPLVRLWDQYTNLSTSLQSALQLLNDPDPSLRSLAEDEANEIRTQLDELVEIMGKALLRKELGGMEDVGALVEIKAGAGGEEACLFVGELMRMYLRYADVWGPEASSRTLDEEDGSIGRGWKTATISESISATSTGKTGYKEVVFEVKGRGAYETLRWENGVHRVQRVPLTETSGRMHTSAVAVVVLPLTEDDAKPSDVNDFYVDEKEVKTEVMRSRGAGGQHVNKTESAVRLTHLPTGISVSMQDSRSQHQNKAWAWKILRSRLFDLKLRQDAEKNRDTRRTLIKGMDRSDKIRTYNFVQDRVTDHRTGYTTMNLDNVMDGEGLEDVIEACRKRHEEEVMSGLLEERA